MILKYFEQYEIPAVFHEENLRIFFLRHFFYIRLLEESYWYKEKTHTHKNVQSLIKLDHELVNACSFFMTVVL